MALMLVALLTVAGFSVDLGDWYFTANREQKAADAGALAGAVFLPGNPKLAIQTAIATVAANGYRAATDTVTVDQDNLLPTQLRVTVTHKVTNILVGIIGLRTTSITRTAIGEYQGPIPMGSPDNRLGNDPDTGFNPQFWLNIDAPNSNKENGDRFAAANCKGIESNCTGSGPQANDEFRANGYAFVLRLPRNATDSAPFNVQVFDAELGYTGDTCGTNGDVHYPTPGDIAGLIKRHPTYYADAAKRYDGAEGGRFCTGDNTTFDSVARSVLSTNLATTYIVRAPDDTPFNDFDNPIATDVSGHKCIVQARTYDLRRGGIGNDEGIITQLLLPGDGHFDDHESQIDRSDDFALSTVGGGTTGVSFAETFRRWFSVCQVRGAVKGDYVLQVKASTSVGRPFTTDLSLAGKNRFSIRSGFVKGTTAPGVGNIHVFGNGRLPIFANAVGADSTFYLARVVPASGDRQLEVPLFDMGDADKSGTLTVLWDPDGDGHAVPYTLDGGCDFERDFGPTIHSNNCRLPDVCYTCGYNGRIVTIVVPIPRTYRCDATTTRGCWFLVNASFQGGTVLDTTTWQATIRGDPVHLIE
jgi:hypothetical protein